MLLGKVTECLSLIYRQRIECSRLYAGNVRYGRIDVYLVCHGPEGRATLYNK